MRHEFFIAKKIFLKETEGKKVSRPIVRISMISIALAIVVNLLTIAVVIGFQKEVRQKVSGFSSHAFILNSGEGSIYESHPIRKEQDFYLDLKKDKNIRTIHPVAFKPILLQSEKRVRYFTNSNGVDTNTVQQDIQGAVMKGVDQDFDWSFYRENLVEGNIPAFNDSILSEQIVLSKTISTQLGYKLGDSIRAYFVKNRPVKRFFTVAGIYHTGLAEFDKKMVLGDLKQVQTLNDWGIQASISVVDTLSDGYMIIKADAQGGNGYYEYNWGNGFRNTIGIKMCPQQDTTIRLIVRDFSGSNKENTYPTSLPDTAYLKIVIDGDKLSSCNLKVNSEGYIIRKYADDTGNLFSVRSDAKTIHFTSLIGSGSSNSYIGGFEVQFKDWEKLDEEINKLKNKLEFTPTKYGELLQISGIKEAQQEIFIWLDFLDLNVYIILILMIIIGIINVGAALLVMILVKTQFIGLMKALGSGNWQLRKIFLYQAFFLIGKGMIWGNVIGIGLCLIQSQFGWITLNPEVYYLSEVPIELSVWHVILLNIITLVVCLSAMILPSAVIAKIEPSKSIKFQ